MRLRILALLCFVLLFLGSASAVYELCDSVERGWDDNLVKLTCNITSTKYYFTQKDIDDFWENLKGDGDYIHGRLGVVEWKLKNAVVQVADDLRFLQPEGMDLNWDIDLSGDFNTMHDINQATATAGRPANLTAIKKSTSAMQDYLISFAPVGNQKSIRNLSLEKPAGAVAVYILGSSINGIEIDIKGDVLLSGAYLEKVKFAKARNIWLKDGAYIFEAGFIEAKNISMEGASFLRDIGSFGTAAIKLQESDLGLILKGKSYIDSISGGIESDSGIYLEESRIETFGYTPSETIQWISAESLTLKGGSSIKGFGGAPGRISLSEGLVLENGKIIGKADNRPSFISAKSISMSDNSVIQNFSEDIDVTGKGLFSLSSGARIENLSGIINSCAPLLLDGNATKIEFSADSPKTVKANGIDLNNGAKIVCIGETDCNYTFVQQACGAMPTATLELDGPLSGNAPFGAKFSGSCEAQDTPVTCTIDFGDGSKAMQFDGNATHIYAETGTFKAVLTATTAEDKVAESEKKITVTQTGSTDEPVQVLLSAQSVEHGGEIMIVVQCDSAIEFISIESDLGLLPAANLPLPCPATFGPFTIPENASVGTHAIVVNTTTTNNYSTAQELSIIVGQKQLIPGLQFELSGFMLYAVEGIVIVAIALVVLLAVMRKRKVPGLSKKIGEKAGAGNEVAERAAKEPGRPQPIVQEQGNKPPWMAKTEENGNGETQTPVVKEQPVEEKPIVQTFREMPAVQTAERPVMQVVEKQEEKPKHASLWQGFMRKPAVPEKDSVQQETEKLMIQAAAEKPRQAVAMAEGQGQDFEGLAEMVKGKGLGKSWWPKAKAKEKPEIAPVEKQAVQKSAAAANVQEKPAAEKGQGKEKQGIFGGFIKKKKPEEEGQKEGNELPPWLRKGE